MKMEANIYLEGDWIREKRRLTNDRLKIAKDNIYENALNLVEKEIDRQLQSRLHTITGQAMYLRQKIKEFTLEKKQSQLELKKRYFPDHDFRNAESRLKTSMGHLGLYLNHFYLEKNQRYPIRIGLNNSTKLNEKLNSKPSEYTKVPRKDGHSNVANNFITKKPKIKTSNNLEIGSKICETNFNSLPYEPQQNPCFDQSKSLPELPALNNKEQRFSILLESTAKNHKDEAESKLPVLEIGEMEESEENVDYGTKKESLKSPNLPNIDIKQILLGKQCSKYENGKESLKYNNTTDSQESKKYLTEILRINQIQNNNLQSKINDINVKMKHFMNKSDQDSSTERDTLMKTHNISETQKRLEKFSSQYENFIVKSDNWKLRKPLNKESVSMDRIALMTMAGLPGEINQDLSVIPLNTARRALRHTASAKMQAFIKELVSRGPEV